MEQTNTYYINNHPRLSALLGVAFLYTLTQQMFGIELSSSLVDTLFFPLFIPLALFALYFSISALLKRPVIVFAGNTLIYKTLFRTRKIDLRELKAEEALHGLILRWQGHTAYMSLLFFFRPKSMMIMQEFQARGLIN